MKLQLSIIFIVLGLSAMLNAMELPPQAPAMVTLISSDKKEFKVPFEIAQKSEVFANILRDFCKHPPRLWECVS
jgi:hypothetical protein